MIKYLLIFLIFIIKIIECQEDPVELPFPSYVYNNDEYPSTNPKNTEFCRDQINAAPKLGSNGLPEYCCGDSPFNVSVKGTEYTIFRNSNDFYKFFSPIPCLNYLFVQNYIVNATTDIYGYRSISQEGVWKINSSLEEIFKSPDTTTLMGFISFYGYVGDDGTLPNLYIYSQAFTIVYINGVAIPPSLCDDSYEEFNYTLSSEYKPGDRVNVSILILSRVAGMSISISEKDFKNINCDKDSSGVCLGRDQYNPPLPDITVCQEYSLLCGSTVVVDKNCTNDNPICEDIQCSVEKGGCVSTSKCGESNLCFIFSCSNVTGCVSSELHCDDSDPCTINSCNNSTGCVYTPMVCDTSSETSCLKNTCSLGKCGLISNCTTNGSGGASTSTLSSTSSTIRGSIHSTTSTFAASSTSSTTLSSTLTTISTTSSRIFSSDLSTYHTTLSISPPDFYCRYDSCPFSYECIQLVKGYSCISEQFCRDCEPDKLKIFY